MRLRNARTWVSRIVSEVLLNRFIVRRDRMRGLAHLLPGDDPELYYRVESPTSYVVGPTPGTLLSRPFLLFQSSSDSMSLAIWRSRSCRTAVPSNGAYLDTKRRRAENP